MKKRCCDSSVEMRELVLPNDTNLFGNLLGGRLMHLVDIAAAMAASRHAASMVTTASIDSVDFRRPIRLGEMVVLKAHVSWVGRTSMEVVVNVCSENYTTGEIKFTNRAYLTFVAVDRDNRPLPVPGLLLENDAQREEYEQAGRRREERLARRSQAEEPCGDGSKDQ